MSITSEYIRPFTKEWWGNFWYYYKWYVIGGILALAFLIFILVDCASRTRADFSITYFGGIEKLGQIDAYRLEDALSPIVPDTDANGEQTVSVNLIYLDPQKQSEEMLALFQMADAELAAGDSVMYFFDERFLDRYSGYCDLSEWAMKYEIPEELLKRTEQGQVYAVEMKGNPIIDNYDIVAEGLYMAVRPLRENDNTQQRVAYYENGLKMAEYILSRGIQTP